MATSASTILPILQPPPRLWVPRRVLITKSARQYSYATAVAERASSLGAEVIELKSDRLAPIVLNTGKSAYAQAKSTLGLVVAPPSSFKLQPIPPSADWQFHLAQGCPAHCQYCYLAGSLSGPPITRVYANLQDILANCKDYLGAGTVTSQSDKRKEEGTTFECSCYTDPLALEHLTGALAQAITFFGEWQAPVQLRWTTKFDNVQPLLSLPHKRKTRVRFSLNASEVARNFEGGTASLQNRIRALRLMCQAGYPVGLTVAPIMDIPDFEASYRRLFECVATAINGISEPDLTAELITHRFTPGSKDVLLQWYPKTPLDLNEQTRSQKRTKFGSIKYVYPTARMRQMRMLIEKQLFDLLPTAKVLYWT